MSCYTKKATEWALIFLVCIQFANASREEVIHYTASKLCPYTNFCTINGTEFPNFPDSMVCCTDCSCETTCTKTRSCCGDKESLLEVKFQATKCKTPYINSNDRDVYGHQVVDYCPTTETNVTLISRCIGEVKYSFEDYVWVEDTRDGIIYQNKFCAHCHHATNYFEWKLTTTCKEVLTTSFENIEALLFSTNCQLILKPPEERDTCFVPDYTKCNQTGIWLSYDADIDWACNVYQSPYFVVHRSGKRMFDVYKNPFCYACNTKTIDIPDTICQYITSIGTDMPFTAFIDYRRFEGLVSSSMCNSNEIMDTITDGLRLCHKGEVVPTEDDSKILDTKLYCCMEECGKKGLCRTLLCPLGTAAKNEECMPLFESTSKLVVDIKFALTVIASSHMYRMDDELQKLKSVGADITAMFKEEATLRDATGFCTFCNIKLEMSNNIPVNTTVTKDNDTFSRESSDSSDLVHFKFTVQILTSSQCQIQDIFEMASKMIGSTFHLHINNEIEMKFNVALLKAQTQTTPILIQNEFLYQCDWPYIQSSQYYFYYLQDEMICPKISIKYSEFSSFKSITDRQVIDGFFTKNEMKGENYVDICIDDYFIKFATLSQGCTYMSARVSGWFGVSPVSLSFVTVNSILTG